MPLKFEIKKKLISRSERIKCVDLHPEHPWVLVSQYSGNLTIYDYTNQTTVKTIENSMAPIRAARFVVRKQWIVAGADDLQIRVYNYNTLEKVKAFDAHQDYIRDIVVHPDQPYIISSSDDACVNIWNFDKGFSLVRSLTDHIHYVMSIAINTRDLNSFCTGSLDKTIKVWGLNSTGTKANYTLLGHEKGVNTVDYYKGDKPFIISGGDDYLVKIWDYQTKQCIHTLEGHQNNISAVTFHPELPLIITGSEDGSVKLWHSQTYKNETSLNYNLERAWSIDINKENPNIIAIGYDEGTVVIKIGSDAPIVSMNNGKVLWAKNLDIRTSNLKSINVNDPEAAKDGEHLNIQLKDVGSVDFQPLGIQHAPNGHSFAVYSDSEYMLFRTSTFKNNGFGNGTDLVFAPNGDYAVRDSYAIRIIKSNNTQHCELKTDYLIEALYGGPLLVARSSEFLIFYDWETAKVIRRIDVPSKKVYWNESGDYVAISTQEDIYILKFAKETLKQILEQQEDNPEGYEESFDLAHEIHEQALSGVWIDNVFYFTTSSGKINYTIMGKVFNFGLTDKKKFLIGYVGSQNKLYLTDKNCETISYDLDSSVTQYLSQIQDKNIQQARVIFKNVPEKNHDKLAKFLDTIDLKEEAFAIVRDQDHKFELALILQNIEAAFEIANLTNNSSQFKQVGDVALFNGKIGMATKCFQQSNDFGSLLMIYSSLGQKEQLKDLAQQSVEYTRMNIAFAAYYLLHDLEGCLEVLIQSQRFSEAALFAKSYLPSKISHCVQLWKEDLQQNYPLSAQKIADPMEYIEEDSYSDLKILLKLEEFYKEQLQDNNVPAHGYQEFKDLLNQDIFSQIKQDSTFDLAQIGSLLPEKSSQQDFIQQFSQNTQKSEQEQQNEE